MYGLLQAARQYYKKFIKVIVTKLGFQKCLANACLLKQTNYKGTLIVCVYVDNILCIGKRVAIDLLNIKLAKHFDVNDKGKMEEYVGCSVVQDVVGDVILHQPHLIKKINRKFGEELADVQVSSMPAGPGDSVVIMNNNKKRRRTTKRTT